MESDDTDWGILHLLQRTVGDAATPAVGVHGHDGRLVRPNHRQPFDHVDEHAVGETRA